MGPTPRLPDLTLADAGRTFVMRPGSARILVVPDGPDVPGTSPDGADVSETTAGPVGLLAEEPIRGEVGTRRYRLEAVRPGTATVRLGQAWWRVEVRGAAPTVEQTSDDTDAGWGEPGSGSQHSRSWWEEQRPPHW